MQDQYSHFIEVRARAFRNLANLSVIGIGVIIGLVGEACFLLTLTSNPLLLAMCMLAWLVLVSSGTVLIRYTLLQFADIGYANHGLAHIRSQQQENISTRSIAQII